MTFAIDSSGRGWLMAKRLRMQEEKKVSLGAEFVAGKERVARAPPV